jgi:hypothetical protein
MFSVLLTYLVLQGTVAKPHEAWIGSFRTKKECEVALSAMRDAGVLRSPAWASAQRASCQYRDPRETPK